MFFSVKQPLRIAGKDYIPCVCYPLPRFLEYTVEHLQAEGKVTIYDKMVFFQNGRLIEKAETKPVVKKVAAEVKPKKEKKTKAVPVANTEDLAKEAEIVPIEEVADDTEGF
jgi:hypothetical protein